MDPHPTSYFSHEKLEVYRESIEFIAWLSPLMDSAARWGDVKDQIDRSSTSMPLNIAEGNDKYTQKDRCHYFDIANASALECAASLDVLVARKKLTPQQIAPGKSTLQKIVRMLMGLIKANSNRIYEKRAPASPPQSPPQSQSQSQS